MPHRLTTLDGRFITSVESHATEISGAAVKKFLYSLLARIPQAEIKRYWYRW